MSTQNVYNEGAKEKIKELAESIDMTGNEKKRIYNRHRSSNGKCM